MHKYELCISETKKVTFLREEAGAASLVDTTQEPNRTCIGMLRQSTFQLEVLIVRSADTTVLVWTPWETTNIGTTEMDSDWLTKNIFIQENLNFQQYGRRWWVNWPSWETGTTSVFCVITPPTGKTTRPGTYWPSTLAEVYFILRSKQSTWMSSVLCENKEILLKWPMILYCNDVKFKYEDNQLKKN